MNVLSHAREVIRHVKNKARNKLINNTYTLRLCWADAHMAPVTHRAEQSKQDGNRNGRTQVREDKESKSTRKALSCVYASACACIQINVYTDMCVCEYDCVHEHVCVCV